MKNKEFLNNIDQLSQEYELTREQTIQSFEKGLVSGCKKNYQVKSCRTEINPEYDEIFLYKQYLVIDHNDEETPNANEYSCLDLEEAQKLKEDAQVGDIIEIEVDPKDFNFYASKDFKNKFNEELIKQKRETIYNFFKNYENKLISGKVIAENDHFYTLELEKEINTLLSKKETLLNDNFHIGERILVFVAEVQNTTKMPKIFVSRVHVNFVVELLKEFVPEVQEGIIKIMGIARIPSDRIKIGLISTDPKVDPIGSCIGEGGSRIKSVVSILKGEKIDLFQWSSDPIELITNSLQPAQILKITAINEKNKTASVVVADDQVSLVIGKLGKNVKLAAQVTKWNINIQTLSQQEEVE
ncbi:transcription termination factor NusA [Candidatus Phytoplasma pruni]|uniref:Transcription termination/antitermination protein NusA n=1 Tax=Candidatus Phytoplasma pruni TaxID=479893 RepID=A0A851HK42_9MOLU|nr:transcription termination factor NusA [Candidatus Phytoplasma pruni]NWN45896.1 transcription termination/antitermination protein NusA [Candidatus Phytoplasma pruni]